ncbi:hypothetical protein LCGC14_2010900, partial [marine sediment metagenome]
LGRSSDRPPGARRMRLSERVLARMDAVVDIARYVGTYTDATWSDQMSALAAVGHVFCGQHTIWKLPSGHPDPETADDDAVSRRLGMVAHLNTILEGIALRDRDDVVDAAGLILFDSRWRIEDYDPAVHLDYSRVTPPGEGETPSG